MTLGQYIKQLRTQLSLSQPQFAERMQVEQSYLSKLENDKSTPSNEVFRQLLDALDMDINIFMTGIKASGNVQALRHIPDIEAWYLAQRGVSQSKQRKLLYGAMLLIAFGIASFYTGFQKLLLPETLYEYRSEGVILDDEPENIFRVWRHITHDAEQRALKEVEMIKRVNTQTLLTFEHQGKRFVERTEQGRRKYYLENTSQQTRLGNVFLQFIGLFSAITGLVLLIIEPRLSRHNQ